MHDAAAGNERAAADVEEGDPVPPDARACAPAEPAALARARARLAAVRVAAGGSGAAARGGDRRRLLRDPPPVLLPAVTTTAAARPQDDRYALVD